MDIWPLQLIVVGLEQETPPPGLIEQLRSSRASGVIQVIDCGIVRKGKEGEISLHAATDIEIDPSPHAGKLVDALFGGGLTDESKIWQRELSRLAAQEPQLFGLSPDDLAEITDSISRNSSALVLLIEQRWSAGFAESVATDRDVLLAQGNIVPRTLLELSSSADPPYEPV